MLNASQLAQQYATALACPMTSATSPCIPFSPSSEEACVNGTSADLSNGLLSGKTTSLSSPSALYFYNQHSAPTMYPTEFLRL